MSKALFDLRTMKGRRGSTPIKFAQTKLSKEEASTLAAHSTAKGWLTLAKRPRWVTLNGAGMLSILDSVHSLAGKEYDVVSIELMEAVPGVPSGYDASAADCAFSLLVEGTTLVLLAKCSVDRDNWLSRLRAAAAKTAMYTYTEPKHAGDDEFSSSADDEIDPAPYVEPVQPLVSAELRGWTAERVNAKVLQGLASFNMQIEGAGATSDWYQWLAENEHELYLGRTPELGPIAVALCTREMPATRELISVVFERSGIHYMRRLTSRGRSSRAELKTALANVSPAHAKLAKKLVMTDEPGVRDKLLELEASHQCNRHKFGVVYVKQGQVSEAEFLANDAGDPADAAFLAFLSLLGTRVPLRGWNGYRAGLDVENGGTGEASVFADFKGYDIMYHVAPFLPHDREHSGQEVQRKRQIGNDITGIVFVDGTTPYDPASIVCQFLHVYAVVQPGSAPGSYRVQFVHQTCVAPFGPLTPTHEWPGDESFVDFLLTKLCNGERSALRSATSFTHKARRTQTNVLSSLLDTYGGAGQARPLAPYTRPKRAAHTGPRAAIVPTPVSSTTEPLQVSLEREIAMDVTGYDAWGSSVLYTGPDGLFAATAASRDSSTRLSRSSVSQLAVIESHGAVLMQSGKTGALIVWLISAVGACQPEEVIGTRGCEHFAVGEWRTPSAAGDGASSRLFLVTVTGKEVLVFEWQVAFFHRVSRVALPSPASFVRYCRHGFVLGHDKGFVLLDPLRMAVRKLLRFHEAGVTDRRATDALFLSSRELLLLFGSFARFVAPDGARTRPFDIAFSCEPQRLVLCRPYVVAVSPSHVEVRSVLNGALVQIVTLPPPISLLSTKFAVTLASKALPGLTAIFTLSHLSDKFPLLLAPALGSDEPAPPAPSEEDERPPMPPPRRRGASYRLNATLKRGQRFSVGSTADAAQLAFLTPFEEAVGSLVPEPPLAEASGSGGPGAPSDRALDISASSSSASGSASGSGSA